MLESGGHDDFKVRLKWNCRENLPFPVNVINVTKLLVLEEEDKSLNYE